MEITTSQHAFHRWRALQFAWNCFICFCLTGKNK